MLDNGIESVDHVVPDGVRTSGLGAGSRTFDDLAFSVVVLDHGQLVLGHAERRPEEGLGADDEVVDEAVEQRRPDLECQISRCSLRVLAFRSSRTARRRPKMYEIQRKTRMACCGTAGIVEAATARVGEDGGVAEPVLESAAGQVRRQLGDQERTELRMLALAKDLPEIFMGSAVNDAALSSRRWF